MPTAKLGALREKKRVEGSACSCALPRGIPRDTLNQELDLDVRDLRRHQSYTTLLSYWKLLTDYIFKRDHNHLGAVHVKRRYTANSL